jgi:hypothetical protein
MSELERFYEMIAADLNSTREDLDWLYARGESIGEILNPIREAQAATAHRLKELRESLRAGP